MLTDIEKLISALEEKEKEKTLAYEKILYRYAIKWENAGFPFLETKFLVASETNNIIDTVAKIPINYLDGMFYPTNSLIFAVSIINGGEKAIKKIKKIAEIENKNLKLLCFDNIDRILSYLYKEEIAEKLNYIKATTRAIIATGFIAEKKINILLEKYSKILKKDAFVIEGLSVISCLNRNQNPINFIKGFIEAVIMSKNEPIKKAIQQVLQEFE